MWFFKLYSYYHGLLFFMAGLWFASGMYTYPNSTPFSHEGLIIMSLPLFAWVCFWINFIHEIKLQKQNSNQSSGIDA